MITLDGVTDVTLLSSDGSIISFEKATPIMISVDVPMDTEVKTMDTNSSLSITSENCMFDRRTVDYICGLLSPTEYKMSKKKHRKKIRTKKRIKRFFKKWYDTVEHVEIENER